MAPSTTTKDGQASLNLNNQIMAKLKPAKIYKNAVGGTDASQALLPKLPPNAGPRSITGISFDDRGDQVVTAGEDETFRLYNCKTGKVLKTLYSSKYGIDLPRFTHKNTAIIYASTKVDDTLRYHSLHDNKYLQYFKGHKEKVISLEVSPIDDGFMSGSMDKTVRLWDLRAPTCRGLLSLPSTPVVAYDATGKLRQRPVFDDRRRRPYPSPHQLSPATNLHDFNVFLIERKVFIGWMFGGAHYVLDAFEGVMIAKLEGHVGLERKNMNTPQSIEPQKGISGEEVGWTPDSKYVIGGSLDGKIFIWDLQNLPVADGPSERPVSPLRVQPSIVLDGHPGPARCVRFNPRLAMMCSAGHELAFWLPDQAGENEEGKEGQKKKGP